MDRLVRAVSMATARATTRRGFLAGVARGLVGAGLGASFLFGGQRLAFADGSCDPGGGCYSCQAGDANGCGGLSYCGAPGACNGTGCNGTNGWETQQCWTCCCSGVTSTCCDCTDGVTTCICQHGGAPC